MIREGIIIPDGYKSNDTLIERAENIRKVREYFQNALSKKLNLTRISAPLFVDASTGLNDNLNGVERPVSFDIKADSRNLEIVHSLAKWKRNTLKRYGFKAGYGLYTNMNAIRRDEDLDNLHSIYVDQWDWEKVINKEDRNINTLKSIVKDIYEVFKETENYVCNNLIHEKPILPKDIFFITTQELEDIYPSLTAKEREDAICKEKKAVFLMEIGDVLKSGKKHDGRAPDYDDWKLNGDILFYYPVLNRAFEVSSMGIRVDEKSLDEQLTKAHCNERRNLKFHKDILEKNMPYTVGGGIGQSRTCMFLLKKVHIGEVQASIWDEKNANICRENGITLL